MIMNLQTNHPCSLYNYDYTVLSKISEAFIQTAPSGPNIIETHLQEY